MREELRAEADRAARAAVDEQHALLVAKTLSAEWSRKMQSETRIAVRVGRDGQDELYKTTYSHRKYTDQAIEIIRRCDPENEAITECYAPVVRDNLECWESRDLRDLQDWHSRVLRSLTFLSQSAERNSPRIVSSVVLVQYLRLYTEICPVQRSSLHTPRLGRREPNGDLPMHLHAPILRPLTTGNPTADQAGDGEFLRQALHASGGRGDEIVGAVDGAAAETR